jgi:hypothetical protein
VYVEGDHEVLDRITAALRSAGLSVDEVQLVARRPEVRRLPAATANWAAYADLGAELSYADWRDEVLSLVATEPPARVRPAPGWSEISPAALRPTG